jgi:hypothetical protein
MESWEIEHIRRSLVMATDSSAPLTAEQAERLVKALARSEDELRRLREGLRELLEEPPA